MNGFLPAEWEPQAWTWIGFPHLAEEWPGVLETAQRQVAAFASALAESGQEVRLLVRDKANETVARRLVSRKVRLERRVYGDIWLRDTGPLVRADGVALRPAFNGWGGKYRMAGDETIGIELARGEGLSVIRPDYVLEGGAIESDGSGTAITTQQCLLNPNRNPEMRREDIDAALARDFGFSQVVWLGEGLINDHTDGHVDNLARFVAPGRVAIARADCADDPNAAIYADAHARARAAGLEVVDIPSPGRIERDRRVEPASYANFVIANKLVVVPLFGAPNDQAAVEAIGALFPTRECIGLPADAVLAGGGGFHCASMQMPRLGAG